VNLDAMLRHTFIPDYTVRAITEVFYVRIKRSLYLAAKRATLMERAKKDTQSEDHFDDEVEKVSIFRFVSFVFITVFYGHVIDMSSASE
jgi:metal transporter CNNM